MLSFWGGLGLGAALLLTAVTACIWRLRAIRRKWSAWATERNEVPPQADYSNFPRLGPNGTIVSGGFTEPSGPANPQAIVFGLSQEEEEQLEYEEIMREEGARERAKTFKVLQRFSEQELLAYCAVHKALGPQPGANEGVRRVQDVLGSRAEGATSVWDHLEE